MYLNFISAFSYILYLLIFLDYSLKNLFRFFFQFSAQLGLIHHVMFPLFLTSIAISDSFWNMPKQEWLVFLLDFYSPFYFFNHIKHTILNLVSDNSTTCCLCGSSSAFYCLCWLLLKVGLFPHKYNYSKLWIYNPWDFISRNPLRRQSRENLYLHWEHNQCGIILYYVSF